MKNEEANGNDRIILPYPSDVDPEPIRYKDERAGKLVRIFEDTMQKISEDEYLISETRRMKNESRLYLDDYVAETRKAKSEQYNITVVEDTTFSCAGKHVREGKVSVLNFANGTHPGGGVTRGSVAQEECLCRSSNLYAGLDTPYFYKHYYDYNANHHRRNLGSDSVIYLPGVTVFKDDKLFAEDLPRNEWFQVDVITCAAPRVRGEHPYSRDEQKKIHHYRALNILEVAIANDVDILILGAFGCGAFHNDPTIVAEAYKELLVDYTFMKCFKEVIFAIKKDRNDVKGNYECFRNVFMN